MDLKLYLESRNLTHAEFAAMVGVTPSSISNYICGTRQPTLKIGRAIEKATRGKVSIEDLLAYWESKQAHE